MKAGVFGLLASMLLARAAALAASPRSLQLAAGVPRLAGPLRAPCRSLTKLMAPAEGAVAEAPLVAAAPIVLPTNENSDRLLRIRHSTAHVMAMAVQRLFKDAKVTIGPWIEKGFYYDFDKETPFEDKDLRRIKKEMDKLIGLKLPFTGEEVTYDEAKRRIEEIGEPYKLEILEGIHTRDPTAAITIYRSASRARRAGGTCAPGRTLRTRASFPRTRSSSRASPAPTGAATRSGRCSSASTARRGRRPSS